MLTVEFRRAQVVEPRSAGCVASISPIASDRSQSAELPAERSASPPIGIVVSVLERGPEREQHAPAVLHVGRERRRLGRAEQTRVGHDDEAVVRERPFADLARRAGLGRERERCERAERSDREERAAAR